MCGWMLSSSDERTLPTVAEMYSPTKLPPYLHVATVRCLSRLVLPQHELSSPHMCKHVASKHRGHWELGCPSRFLRACRLTP